MCGICRTVNCIRRKIFGSCCGYTRSDCYGYNGCDNDCYNNGCSRYSEPRMNVICANQRDNGFTPCCDNKDIKCHKHHHDCGCDD